MGQDRRGDGLRLLVTAMKASELIKELQEKIDQYGDLRVAFDDGHCTVEGVSETYATKESINEIFEGGSAKTDPWFELET